MRALIDILLLGFRGRIVRRVKRLRDPRQILAAVAGLAYMGYFFLRPFLFGAGLGRRGMPRGMAWGFAGMGEYAAAIQLAIALGLATVVVLTWIFTSPRPAFRLSEAEIHLLFPAPVTRRQILNFALIKQQAGILFGACILLVFNVVRGGVAGGLPLPRFLCYWGFLTLLDLHIKGVSLAKARWTEIPAAAAARQRVIAAAIGTAWVAAVAWGVSSAWRLAHVGASLAAGEIRGTLLAFVHAVLGGLAGTALTPFLWLGAPLARAGAARLGGSLFLVAMVALHYEWVVRSSARFEDAALDRARRRAARGRRRRSWESLSRSKRTRAPFRLEAARVPELAITWKNIILRSRIPLALLARRTLLGLAALAVAYGALTAFGLPGAVGAGIAGVTFVVMGIVPLLAGSILRNDLHVDFQHLETLRAWPISGWRLVAAEILAPATALAWLELTGAGIIAAVAVATKATGGASDLHAVLTALPARLLGGAGLGVALAAVLTGTLLLGLSIGLFSITLQNLGVLLFPGWVPLGYSVPRGTSMLGQNLVVSFGRLIGLALGSIVPFLGAGLVFLVLNVLLSLRLAAWELPLLAAAAALPYLLETYLMLRAAGAIWDRLDPSRELLEPVG